MLREPLLHFAVAGAALFALDAWVFDRPDPKTIDVPAATAQRLVQQHERRTGSPPTAEQRKAIVDRWVDDEVLYREALALGLDQNDPVIRGRLVEKMRFLTTAAARNQGAVEQGFDYIGRSGAAAAPAVSFTHVFLGPDDRRAHDVLAELKRGADPQSLGAPFAHPPTVLLRSLRWVDTRFGGAFSAAVGQLTVGQWSGPIRSAYGHHLVRVDATSEVPGAEQRRRQAAERDVADARRKRAERSAVQALRQ